MNRFGLPYKGLHFIESQYGVCPLAESAFDTIPLMALHFCPLPRAFKVYSGVVNGWFSFERHCQRITSPSSPTPVMSLAKPGVIMAIPVPIARILCTQLHLENKYPSIPTDKANTPIIAVIAARAISAGVPINIRAGLYIRIKGTRKVTIPRRIA